MGQKGDSRDPARVRVVAVAALVVGVAVLTWRVGWTLAGTNLLLSVPLLAAELFGWVSLAVYVFFVWRLPESARPDHPAHRPTVDVFVCTYDEPESVLRATLAGCRELAGAHTTWLLDDGRRAMAKRLAREFDAEYLSRSTNEHAKAGNINNALSRTDGELILVLDADHVPLPALLDATLGYFDDPEVALVQTPHSFSNRHSAQHSLDEERHEQQMFYDVVMPGKDRHNSVFWCGSATVIRRSALVGIGGVLTDTIAEDFHTTLRLHARGWRTRYHDETLVQGLAPNDLSAFLLQRDRWARGNLRVFRTRENPLTCEGLTTAQRISYTGSLMHYFTAWQRFVLLLVLLVTLATGILPLSAPWYLIVGFWLPAALLSWCASLVLARGRLGGFDGMLYGYLTMGIYMRASEVLVRSRRYRFRVTPKEGIDEGGWPVVRQLLLVTAIASALVLVLALRLVDAFVVPGLMPPLEGFALVATMLIGMGTAAIMWALIWRFASRRQMRMRYRMGVDLPARVSGVRVRIRDLTPEGIGFVSPVPLPVGSRKTARVRLPRPDGTRRIVEVPMRIVSSRPEPSGWAIGSRVEGAPAGVADALEVYCHVTLPMELYSSPPRPSSPESGEPEALAEVAAALDGPGRSCGDAAG